MQHEIESLDRRISDLEDVELEVMERLEAAQATLDAPAATSWRRSTPRPPSCSSAARDRRRPRSTTELARSTGRARDAASRTCPADLLALYEKLRASQGRRRCGALCGSGAAAVPARRSNAADLAAIAPAPRRRGAALRGVQPDPGAHRRVRVCDARARTAVVIEADGGSRGNPGPAGVRRRAPRRRHRRGDRRGRRDIGTATNNVAEYRGLIAGLELLPEHAPDADARGADGLQAGRRADVRAAGRSSTRT